MKKSSALSALSFLLLAILLGAHAAPAQVSSNDRDMVIGMLGMTKDSIKNNYFDPKYKGIDLDFVFEQAHQRIKTAPTRDAMMLTIASAVMAFDDSHTRFIPPARAADIDYGWLVQMVGDECYIAHVKPKSDAEAKGVKRGDKLIAIDGFKPTRNKLWQMYYRYFTIAPTSRVSMTLLSPDSDKPRTVEVDTKISKSAGLITIQTLYERGTVRDGWWDSSKVHEFREFGNDLLIWKMHTFSVTDSSIDSAMGRAKKAKTLILDLRGNGGGLVDITKRLVGYFFDTNTKIGDHKTRKENEELIAKTRGDIFKGDLIVLLDHNSASASEVFAKVVQLQKRGKVIGDGSRGAVMTSKFYQMDSGFGNNLYFGASITIGDLIMTDGKSLEKVGVTPDVVMLPTGRDMADNKDPVLAHAAKMAGVEITPEEAGKFFPFEWPK